MSNGIELGFDIEALINKGKKRNKYKFEYLKEGAQGFRILPSFDPSNRRIESTHAVHWLTGENGKIVKAACTYYTEKFCPLCTAHKETKEAYDHASKSDPTSQNTKRLAEAMKKLSVSRSTFYNAVNASGEPVILELNQTVAKLLEGLIIEAYQKKNFDATALAGGVWFEFTKVGKGRDSVRVDYKRLSKMVEGELVDVLDRTALSPDLLARLPTAVANIHDKKTLWIKECSSQELADYLRGKPLPNTNYGNAGAASTEETDDTEVGQAPDAEAAPVAQAPVQQAAPAPAPVKQVQSAAPVVATYAAPAKSLQDYASHAERLKKLANPNG